MRTLSAKSKEGTFIIFDERPTMLALGSLGAAVDGIGSILMV